MLISKGAEAEIYLEEGKIIKNRISKRYRIKELDLALRKFRTKREAKIMTRLPAEISHPQLLKTDDTAIEMTYLQGKKVRDILDSNLDLCEEIGEKVALMHNAGIIHGDLTTSNMILFKGKIYLIDFGLSFFSRKTEDKAVDLHLLYQALESKHYKVVEKAFKLILKGYSSKSHNFNEIMIRFHQVQQRGRNKSKF